MKIPELAAKRGITAETGRTEERHASDRILKCTTTLHTSINIMQLLLLIDGVVFFAIHSTTTSSADQLSILCYFGLFGTQPRKPRVQLNKKFVV